MALRISIGCEYSCRARDFGAIDASFFAIQLALDVDSSLYRPLDAYNQPPWAVATNLLYNPESYERTRTVDASNSPSPPIAATESGNRDASATTKANNVSPGDPMSYEEEESEEDTVSAEVEATEEDEDNARAAPEPAKILAKDRTYTVIAANDNERTRKMKQRLLATSGIITPRRATTEDTGDIQAARRADQNKQCRNCGRFFLRKPI
ncbi:hypothetical protein ACLMJK_009590 [Lecanora helva]